jgi:hypothetical protein
MKAAAFPAIKTIEEFDCPASPEWVRTAEDYPVEPNTAAAAVITIPAIFRRTGI